jgi:hypothetical protein
MTVTGSGMYDYGEYYLMGYDATFDVLEEKTTSIFKVRE